MPYSSPFFHSKSKRQLVREVCTMVEISAAPELGTKRENNYQGQHN